VSRRLRSLARGSITARELKTVARGSYPRHEALVRATLQYLALCGVPAIPVFTGPKIARGPDGQVQLRKNRAQRGLSDVLATLPPDGRTFLIECKTGEARRSPDQVQLHDRFLAAGAVAAVIRDVRELEQYVRHEGVRFQGEGL
jgi:hypothetical protein